MELTIQDLKSLIAGQENECGNFWKVGNAYLIRTVTMAQVGRLESITSKELVLTDASWVADTGRFSEALSSGTLEEVERVSKCLVNRTAIIDAFDWNHPLPQHTK